MDDFKITGPGAYRTRDGRRIEVRHSTPDRREWLGDDVLWRYADGRCVDLLASGNFDIVGPWPEFNQTPLHSDHDPVNHPTHYTEHPSGVECITITEHMNFNLGNAVKYIWRAERKNGIEDLRKAEFCIKREIARLERGKP